MSFDTGRARSALNLVGIVILFVLSTKLKLPLLEWGPSQTTSKFQPPHDANCSLMTSDVLVSQAETAFQRLDTAFFSAKLSNAYARESEIGFPERLSEYSFPFTWDEETCALSTSLHSSGHPIRVAFLGGSATARSASECNSRADGGRYSDILAQDMEQDLGSCGNGRFFEMVNLAHGATDSCWNALMLDELLDVNTTDLIVWEFAINDALGGCNTGHRKQSEEQMKQMLDLWLWRLYKLFSSNGRRVPPIILLYLWDSGCVEEVASRQSAFEAQASVVEYYRRAANGLFRISVINVGEAVSGRNNRYGPGQLLDDLHHPACAGNHLISAMLRYVLYSEIVSCKKKGPAKNSVSQQKQKHDLPLQPLTMTLSRESSTDNEDALLSALLGDSDIGSLMQWKPQAGTSRLHISNKESSGVTTETLHGAKSSETRADRKISYKLPICPEKVSLTLLEPSLEWMGLGFSNGREAGYFKGQVQVFINGALVNNTSTNKNRLKMDNKEDTKGRIRALYVDQWIGIGRDVLKAQKYQLEVCTAASSQPKGEPMLNWIIGVKTPTQQN